MVCYVFMILEKGFIYETQRYKESNDKG